MKSVVFDAGALTAYEKADCTVVLMTKFVGSQRGVIVIPAPVVGQVWRDGARQARLAHLLRSALTRIEPLDDRRARAAGQLCGLRRTHDVIDAAVVMCAREHKLPIATSDGGDLRRLDPHVVIYPV